MVGWMGEYALLEARPDGEFTGDIEGTPVRGRYRELDPPNRVVFTWGFAGSDELPPGSSTVEVLFVREAGATRVEIVHSGPAPRQEAPTCRGLAEVPGLARDRIRSGLWSPPVELDM
jgi:uncharacterized protein YndB with AHSA1/START domain